MREALALAVGDTAAEKARNEALDMARILPPALARTIGLSVRDVGEHLGLSHQRVHQLARQRR